ncbi:hypothetical protein ACQ4PT_029181 [Festuca glaucescens]
MAESVQNWRKKWFYIKDEKTEEQKFGLAPFDPSKSVKKLKSWDQPLTEAEPKETEPLMARIHTLQTDEGKELSDAIPSSCRVTPFDKKHPPPAGHVFLSSLPPLPEAGEVPKVAADAESETPKTAAGQNGVESDEDEASDSSRTVTSIPPANSQDEKIKGKRKRADDKKDEEETPKDPVDDPAKNLPAFIKTPSKTLSSHEETVNSEKLEGAEESPQAPPKKKLKEHDANKGIKISENQPMPSMDDPIAREMMDMAIRHIEFRDEAKSLEVEKIGDSYEMPEDQKTDPLLDLLTMLEANNVRVRNMLVHARRAFTRLFGHFFLRQKQPEDLLALADVFNAQEDPVLNYRRATTKTGMEIVMAIAMAHGEVVDWDKVSSSHAVDKAGQPMSLVPFLKNAKKFSKKMISLVHPTSAPPASATPSEV